MRHTDLTEKLIQFGLTQKEAATYIALLKLSRTSASAVARESGINRSTTYVLLESLVKKGLVSRAAKKDGQVQLYTAASPKRFMQIAEEGKQKYDQLGVTAQSMLSELNSLEKDVRQKTRVRYFDGLEGVIATYENTLTSNEPITAFASSRDMTEILPDYFPQYYKRRTERGIRIKSIHSDTDHARKRMPFNKEELRDARMVPSVEFNFSPEIKIYDNKLVLMSLKEQFGIIIESAELADAFLKIFKLAWNASNKVLD